MNISQFDYDLPKELIAFYPTLKRDESRLFFYNRETGFIFHNIFKDLPDLLNEDDILVINDTKVQKARFYGRLENGRKVECLIVTQLSDNVLECMVKPAKRINKDDIIHISENGLFLKVIDEKPYGRRILTLNGDSSLLNQYLLIPLPPYIKRSAEAIDGERYQTVYAAKGRSVAAPTAGLHFTVELLDKLKDRGIKIATVNLNVGPATFLPVRTSEIERHIMEDEEYKVDAESASLLNDARDKRKRIIAVGTTTARVLETLIMKYNRFEAESGRTRLFLYPGRQFNAISGLITNFHLPKSTLLMLVSAFIGLEKILKLYKIAIEKNYRFYSYGDAMLII